MTRHRPVAPIIAKVLPQRYQAQHLEGIRSDEVATVFRGPVLIQTIVAGSGMQNDGVTSRPEGFESVISRVTGAGDSDFSTAHGG